MSAGKLTWGRRDWLGLMALFLSSIAADVIGALLAVKDRKSTRLNSSHAT